MSSCLLAKFSLRLFVNTLLSDLCSLEPWGHLGLLPIYVYLAQGMCRPDTQLA